LVVYYRETGKDLPAARKAFEKALELAPGYYSAMFNMAVVERSRGDTKSAEEWLLRSLAALNADPAAAVSSWAHEYEKTGRAAGARTLLECVARAYPERAGVGRDIDTHR